MERKKLGISLALVFVALCLYYHSGWWILATVILPVAAHELSHVLMLRLLGQRITGIALETGGLCIHYDGICSAAGHIAGAVAGPAGGVAYAAAASHFAHILDCDWLAQSSGLSMLLTAFNLVPLRPLDGGRIFSTLCVLLLGTERGEKLCDSVSAVCLAVLLIFGVTLAVWKKSTLLLAAAIWLLLFQNEEEALVKKGKII